jgi:hypothetical protein
MTVNDLQRRQLDKLLSNPEKEVKLPEGLGARMGGVRAPREMIKSVAGSAAAAGSGEFHVYKQSRRREAERIRHMEETNRLVSAGWGGEASLVESCGQLWIVESTEKNNNY